MDDLRHACRQLARAPGFTLLAVLSLAVGIGINTTIFTAMHAAFLQPLPLAAPDEIVTFERPLLSLPEYQQVRSEMASLSGLVASTRENRLLRGRDQIQLAFGRAVSGNYFAVLGAEPIAGRFFDERSPDLADPIVVIGYGLWQRQFGGDPRIVGQTIELNGQPCTVVGIAPRGFVGEDRLPPTELWYPLASRPAALAAQRRLWLTGRLRASVSPSQARAEAAVIFARPEWQDLGVNRLGERVRVVSEHESRMDHGGRATFLMGPVVGLVLLVACANVSCLLLGRYEMRRREIAVRLALGAGRWRVLRYLLAEGLLLALGGGVLGLLLTLWGVQAIPAVLPPAFASWAPEMHLDRTVLGLALGLSLFATLAAGLMPAWRASRLDVSTMLKTESVQLGKTPSRNVLVVSQVMIATVFLAIAALFVRGFQAGAARDLGFTARDVLFAQLVPERRPPRDPGLILDEVRQAIGTLRGVQSVALASDVLGGRPLRVLAPEDEATGNASGRQMPCNHVDPGYFAALGIPLLAGRDFTPRDHQASARVAIVSESMAKRFWPGESPVGKTLFAGRTELLPREVVGVVRDIDSLRERRDTEPLFYLPLRQEMSGGFTLIVNTRSSAAALTPALREALKRTDSGFTPFLFDTIEGRMRATLLPQWFGAWLGGVLGGLAFVLAASGLYGVVAYAVARRTRELGIRIAIGASPRAAAWLVLRQGVILAVIGVGLGLPVAIAAGGLMQSLLVGVSPMDPTALIGAALLVVGIAALASWLPARRATQVNPMVALRAE